MNEAITASIASTTEAVTEVLTTNLPVVMVVFGGLLALGVILRVVRSVIGRRK